MAEFVHKPEVMAGGWLLGVCEWPAMLALRSHIRDDECSLGTRFELAHLAPVPAGATLTVHARCAHVDGRYREWQVDARDDLEPVASGILGFCVVSLDRFTARRLAPESEFLRRRPVACGALVGAAGAG